MGKTYSDYGKKPGRTVMVESVSNLNGCEVVLKAKQYLGPQRFAFCSQHSYFEEKAEREVCCRVRGVPLAPPMAPTRAESSHKLSAKQPEFLLHLFSKPVLINFIFRCFKGETACNKSTEFKTF